MNLFHSDDVSLSLEIPTMASANGAAGVMGIVEFMSPAECRLRSVSTFAIGDSIAFDFAAHGVAKIALRGRVISSSQDGARHTYALSLDHMPIDQRDKLAGAIEAARQHAAERAHAGHPPEDGNARSSARIPVNFTVRFEKGSGDPDTARATALSTGGMLIDCVHELAIGSSIELHFSLPMRASAPQEVQAHARVIARQHGTTHYNLAFFHVDNAAHAAIERFLREATPAT